MAWDIESRRCSGRRITALFGRVECVWRDVRVKTSCAVKGSLGKRIREKKLQDVKGP